MDVDQKVKSIIYYTDNRIDDHIIFQMAQKHILEAGLPIVSCSLRPMNFGRNIPLVGLERSYPTMVIQILAALEASTAKYVFFCEHDVLYHPSHFGFIPPREDLFYYNVNNYRWLYPEDRLITYNSLTSLSSLCCSRELAVDHYRRRHQRIEEFELYAIKSKEPKWARRLGYEPGTKPVRRGGFSDEEHVRRYSEFPNIDIRHKWTFSAPKVRQEDFKHKPSDWREEKMDNIPGWSLRSMFSL